MTTARTGHASGLDNKRIPGFRGHFIYDITAQVCCSIVARIVDAVRWIRMVIEQDSDKRIKSNRKNAQA
jgi:hypothetical protein